MKNKNWAGSGGALIIWVLGLKNRRVGQGNEGPTALQGSEEEFFFFGYGLRLNISCFPKDRPTNDFYGPVDSSLCMGPGG